MRYNKNGEYLYVAVAQLSGVQILPAGNHMYSYSGTRLVYIILNVNSMCKICKTAQTYCSEYGNGKNIIF